MASEKRERPSMKIQPLLVVLALTVPAPALAQQRGPIPDAYQEAVPPPEVYETTNNKALDRRLDRTEKALRELRAIVLKAQAQGAPVEVRPVGPDPAVTDLQQRFSDMEATVRDLTGQQERLRFDLDQSRRDTAAAQAQVAALTQKLEQAQAAPQITPPPPGAPVAAAPNDEAGAYAQARQMIDAGDFAGGADAMDAFIQTYPGSSRVGTANYWAGRALAARSRHTEAAAAFARSLKGWPQASWAGDAVVQLAGSLTAMKRAPDACKALNEFDGRYAAKASANVKAQAARVRTNADCG